MVTTILIQHHGMQLHTLLGVQRSHFALHSYAFMENIEVICPCYYEALIWKCSKLEVTHFILILYLVYSISGTPG
jgi:hypothetical protein